MLNRSTFLFLWLLLFFLPLRIFGQQEDRVKVIEQKLTSLSSSVPGLKQNVQLLISGIPLQEYINGIARSNDLNISVDPKLNFNIYDTFSDVTAENILVYLARKYNLNVNVTGTIIEITAYQEPTAAIPVKEIKAKYSQLNNTLSLELDNDSLVTVARRITAISGRNVIVSNGLSGKKVSGFIAAAPFETALEKLAYANEISMTKTSDDFYIFQPLAEGDEVYINGDRNTSVRHTYKPATAVSGGSNGVYSRIVNGQKLISVDAVNAPILDLVKQVSQELGKNYTLYSELKGSITIHVTDVSYDELLIMLFRGTDYSFRQQNGFYMMGDRKLQGIRDIRVISLQHRSIDTVVAMLPSDWKREVEIKEFREQNTLLVSGSTAQLDEISSFVKQIDVPVPVILIEVILLDIEKTRAVSTGIAAGVSDSVKTGGTVLPGINFTFSASSVNDFLGSVGKIAGINLGHVVPNFYVSLNALETNNDINVRSVPKLTALNGHTATLSIGSVEYYKNTSQNVIPSAATSQSIYNTTYQETDANLTVAIKPVVSGDDQVTLGIKVDIADFTSIPTDGSPPPKSVSKYETSLRVNNEDMILLGGIERTETDLSASGTPILSRIPILKYIFSSRTKTTKKVITVLFIKPTIMR